MFIKLCITFFLFGLILQASSQTAITISPSSALLNKYFDTIQFESIKYFDIILLSSENTCGKCYDILYDSILIKHKLKTANILRIGGDYLSKRTFFLKYKVFKYIDSSYFDVFANSLLLNDSCNDGFFSITRTCRTPALLIRSNNNQFIVFKYEDIFDVNIGLKNSFINNLSKVLK